MKALGQASIFEQILLRFVSSAAHNQELLRVCRRQFQALLDKQDAARGDGVVSTELSFSQARELLKGVAGAQEQQRILSKIDTDVNAKVSFDEFQAAMAASIAEQDRDVLRTAFRQLDRNNDHYVTVGEIQSSLTTNEQALHRVRRTQNFQEQIADFVAVHDGDGNKKLDMDEFVAAMERFAFRDPEETVATDEGD